MRRIFTLLDEATGVELTLPVTPSGYSLTHGIAVETIGLDGLGDIHLPGLPRPVELAPIEALFPAQLYSFCNAGARAAPFWYLERLERWCDAHTILRYILSETPCNVAVFIESIQYGEEDGTGNLHGVIRLRGHRAPKTADIQTGTATTTAAAATTAKRPVDTAVTATRQYQVAAGDTLSAISRRFYGNAGLSGRLAAANGIQNPNLISVGQVLTIPPVGALPAAKKPSTSQRVAAAATVKKDEKGQVKAQYTTPEGWDAYAKSRQTDGWRPGPL